MGRETEGEEMKIAKWHIYFLLMAAWGYFSVHYWCWLLEAVRVDWRYMIVETWLLMSFIMFTALGILVVREEV